MVLRMGVKITIILIFASIQLNAEKWGIIIAAKEPPFQKSAIHWNMWLKSVGTSEILKNQSDNRFEIQQTLYAFSEKFILGDTLIIIFIGHGVVDGSNLAHSMLLSDSRIEITRQPPNDYLNYLYEEDILKYLYSLYKKNLKVILFIDACLPYSILSPTNVLDNMTVIYASMNENIGYINTGLSMFSTYFLKLSGKIRLFEAIDYVNKILKDKSLYPESVIQYYPIQSKIYGNDIVLCRGRL